MRDTLPTVWWFQFVSVGMGPDPLNRISPLQKMLVGVKVTLDKCLRKLNSVASSLMIRKGYHIVCSAAACQVQERDDVLDRWYKYSCKAQHTQTN